MSTTVPALSVQDVAAVAVHYRDRFGFTIAHQEEGFATLLRDQAEIHLWGATDESWRTRTHLAERPVVSGGESFLAGTASCRIAVDDVDGLYAELRAAEVLHPTDPGSAVDTDWGTREFATLDLEGNLLTFFQRR